MTIGLIASLILNVLFAHGYINNLAFETASDYAAQSMFYKVTLNTIAFLAIAYFFIFFWSRSGQTLGMRAWKLRVQTQQGYVISKITGLKRLLVSFLGLGSLTVLIDRKNKLSLQDRLTNTEIVVLSLEANKGTNWSNGE